MISPLTCEEIRLLLNTLLGDETRRSRPDWKPGIGIDTAKSRICIKLILAGLGWVPSQLLFHVAGKHDLFCWCCSTRIYCLILPFGIGVCEYQAQYKRFGKGVGNILEISLDVLHEEVLEYGGVNAIQWKQLYDQGRQHVQTHWSPYTGIDCSLEVRCFKPSIAVQQFGSNTITLGTGNVRYVVILKAGLELSIEDLFTKRKELLRTKNFWNENA